VPRGYIHDGYVGMGTLWVPAGLPMQRVRYDLLRRFDIDQVSHTVVSRRFGIPGALYVVATRTFRVHPYNGSI